MHAAARCCPPDLPAAVLEAIGDAVVAAVAPRTAAASSPTTSSARRMADPACSRWRRRSDPYVAVAEVDRLDWIERRLPVPEGAGRRRRCPAAGTRSCSRCRRARRRLMPEHRARPDAHGREPGQGAAVRPRDPGRLAARSTPALDLRLRSIQRRLLGRAATTPAAFTPPYSRYTAARLFEILAEMQPSRRRPGLHPRRLRRSTSRCST